MLISRYNITGQRVLDLTSVHVRSLTDGRLFLVNLGLLRRDLDLEPRCRHCLALGANGVVDVALEDLHARVHCAHRWGRIKRDQPLDVEPLLAACDWALCCARCGHSVEGANGRGDAAFSVVCPCTCRTMANPLAPELSPTPMVSLGHAESMA